jgi:hypothetical protein
VSQGAEGRKVRERNAEQSRKIASNLLVRHLFHWICFTEDVISSSSGQLQRIRGSVQMISANATLEPATAERLGEWGRR